VIFALEEDEGRLVARYGWLHESGNEAGRMLVTPRNGKIEQLVVTFED